MRSDAVETGRHSFLILNNVFMKLEHFWDKVWPVMIETFKAEKATNPPPLRISVEE